MKIYQTILAASIFLVSSICSATEVDCSGTISQVLLYSNGIVMIYGSWRNDYTMLCSTQGDWGGIGSDVCLAWYGAAVKARADHANVHVNYASTTATCSTLPTYSSAPFPTYLLVSN